MIVAIGWGLANSRFDGSRLQVFVVMAVYYLAAGRGLFHGGGVFFAGEDESWAKSLGWGAFVWIAPAFTLAATWALCWGREWFIGRTVLALAAVSVPPVGWIGWASPLAGAGVLFPLMGWAGFALSVLLFGLLSLGARAVAEGNWSCIRKCIVAGVVAHAGVATWTWVMPIRPQMKPDAWVAVDTHLGRSDGYGTVIALENAAFNALDDGARVVILPEAVGGSWDLNQWQWRMYQDQLVHQGATVLVGAERSLDRRRLVNGLFSVGVGNGAELPERVPVPLGMWRPWSSTRHVVSDWTGSGVGEVQGRRVGYLICYEQLLLLPVLVSVAHHPDVLVGAANLWWAKGTSIGAIQHSTLAAWGRLFGVPVLSATNA